MGPNPDRAPTRTGPQPGPGPTKECKDALVHFSVFFDCSAKPICVGNCWFRISLDKLVSRNAESSRHSVKRMNGDPKRCIPERRTELKKVLSTRCPAKKNLDKNVSGEESYLETDHGGMVGDLWISIGFHWICMRA